MADQLFGVMVPLGSVFGVKDKSTIDKTDPIPIAWPLRGIVPASWSQCTQDIVGSREKADKVVDQIVNIFVQRGQSEIWATRCEKQVQRERTLGITRRKKVKSRPQRRSPAERRMRRRGSRKQQPENTKEKRLLLEAWKFSLEGIRGTRPKNRLVEK